MDLGDRSIHLCGACAEKSSAQEHRPRGDLPRCGAIVRFRRHPHRRVYCAVQASALARPIAKISQRIRKAPTHMSKLEKLKLQIGSCAVITAVTLSLCADPARAQFG